MKAHPKHIDWGKLTVTQEIMNGEEEEANVAKASEDMKLSIMKEKFLAMVESEKVIVKDYTKLVVTYGMVEYVLEKHKNTWKCEDEISSVILEDLWLKYGKGLLGRGKWVLGASDVVATKPSPAIITVVSAWPFLLTTMDLLAMRKRWSSDVLN
ncbi:hypothetical protein Tco_0837389, partial [Tanacetum coccineum]